MYVTYCYFVDYIFLRLLNKSFFNITVIITTKNKKKKQYVKNITKKARESYSREKPLTQNFKVTDREIQEINNFEDNTHNFKVKNPLLALGYFLIDCTKYH